ncbi:MAG TPA: class I SAM-dependent methyltransferase [Ktedonobacteraceae bacterium]|nr:class I SAM-dependent methyltransferase [Ktedonobacteraceae bacterium]
MATEQDHPVPSSTQKPHTTNHSLFARFYELLSRGVSESSYMEPLRQETAGEARGLVLEVGAGNGLNFSFYDPARVARVEAIEPDTAMLRYARRRVEAARVPIKLTQAAAEDLPFAGEMFDSVVATLVFCSVSDPLRGLREIMRVLKPGGSLFMVDHVRSQGAIASRVQDIVTPITRLVSGNCHWNRDTARSVAEAGFQIKQKRDLSGVLLPMIVLQATR